MKLPAFCFVMTFLNLVAMDKEKNRRLADRKIPVSKRQKVGNQFQENHGTCSLNHEISNDANQVYSRAYSQGEPTVECPSSLEEQRKSQDYYRRLVASRCRCGWIGLTSDLDDK